MALHLGPHDHFVGTTLVNFLVAEVTWAISFLVYLIASWPDPNWDGVMYASAALMIALPVLLYPLTRLSWLAIDLYLRPGDEGERRADEAARHS